MTQQGRNIYECVTIDDETLLVHLLVISVFVCNVYRLYVGVMYSLFLSITVTKLVILCAIF
jgi:hypothetical protein